MATRLALRSLVFIVAVSSVCVPLRADDRKDRDRGRTIDSICMGAPSVFDALALEMALGSAIQQLEANTQIVNLDNVAKAVGNVQGSNINQSYSSISGGLQVPMPASPSATAPAAPTQISAESPKTVSEGPLDLLAEQLQTNCEVVNQRLLLERLISCQLTPGCKRAGRAVIGFPISVNSDRQDAVAEVQIRVTSESSSDAPKILALLPDEKTYNVSMLTSDASQFSLAAAVKIISLGATVGKASQNLYLLQDTDTVALLSSAETWPDDGAASREGARHRRCRDHSGSVVFGWQFRPVFGKHNLSPGTRWVYAVLQLPEGEDATERSSESENAGQRFSVDVRACWRDFCVRNRMVGDEIAETSHGWQAVTPDITIPSENATDYAKSPWISRIRWLAMADGKFKVTISGENFWPGTQVILGSDPLTETKGLTRCGHDQIHFVATISDLALADVHLVDRYGRSKGPDVFISHEARKSSPVLNRQWLNAATAQPAGKEKPRIARRSASQCEVSIDLSHGTVVQLLADTAPWAAIIGTTVVGPDAMWMTTDENKPLTALSQAITDHPEFLMPTEDKNPVTLHFLVDTQVLRANADIKLRRLLLGAWGAMQLPLPLQSEWQRVFSVDQVFWESTYDNPRCLGIAGSGFTEGKFHASVNGTRYEASAVKDTMLEVTLSKEDASAAKTITLFTDDGYPVTCDMPKQDAPADVEITFPAAGISQNDSVWGKVQVNKMSRNSTVANPTPFWITHIQVDGQDISTTRLIPQPQADAVKQCHGKYRLLLASPITDKARLVQFAITLHDPADGDAAQPANCKKDITLYLPDPALEIKARTQQGGSGAQNPKE